MTIPPGPHIAFLLAQIGAEATARFAAALAEVDLTPALAGVLRILATQDGLSQQELARRLGAAPSRLVGYLDDLEGRGAITRAPGADRRVNLIGLTAEGRKLLTAVTQVSRAHNTALVAGLEESQQVGLRELLNTLAEQLGLGPSHPGYGARP